jgi:hypothetical protein
MVGLLDKEDSVVFTAPYITQRINSVNRIRKIAEGRDDKVVAAWRCYVTSLHHYGD